MERYAELLLGIPAEVLLDKGWRETVKPRRDCRVSCKKIARPRNGQRNLKGVPSLFHKTAGAFENREGRMPFIQVTDFRPNAQCPEQPPAANPEKQFLLETQLRPAAI